MGSSTGLEAPMNELDLYNYKDLFAVTWLAWSWGLGSLAPEMVPVEVLWREKRAFSRFWTVFSTLIPTGSTWELNPHSEVR